MLNHSICGNWKLIQHPSCLLISISVPTSCGHPFLSKHHRLLLKLEWRQSFFPYALFTHPSIIQLRNCLLFAQFRFLLLLERQKDAHKSLNKARSSISSPTWVTGTQVLDISSVPSQRVHQQDLESGVGPGLESMQSEMGCGLIPRSHAPSPFPILCF